MQGALTQTHLLPVCCWSAGRSGGRHACTWGPNSCRRGWLAANRACVPVIHRFARGPPQPPGDSPRVLGPCARLLQQRGSGAPPEHRDARSHAHAAARGGEHECAVVVRRRRRLPAGRVPSVAAAGAVDCWLMCAAWQRLKLRKSTTRRLLHMLPVAPPSVPWFALLPRCRLPNPRLHTHAGWCPTWTTR